MVTFAENRAGLPEASAVLSVAAETLVTETAKKPGPTHTIVHAPVPRAHTKGDCLYPPSQLRWRCFVSAHQIHVGNENGDEQKRKWCDRPYPLLRNLYKTDELSIWLDLVVEDLRAFQHLRRSDTSQTVHIKPFRNRSAQTMGLVDWCANIIQVNHSFRRDDPLPSA